MYILKINTNKKGEKKIMILTDTFGWMKRNISKMSDFEQKKMLNEVNQIKLMLERNLKTKGVV
jgi:hypothetical protein